MNTEEKVLLNATVCLLVKGKKVLLAIKTDKIGAGCWNGYGGGIEEGETPIQSSIRELQEESNLTIKSEDLEKVAIVYFHNKKTDGNIFICKCHFFIGKNWKGMIKDSKEMITPTFFNIDSLPIEKMMLADKDYFPLILNGKKIIAKAYYGPFQKSLLKKTEIEEVESFPED